MSAPKRLQLPLPPDADPRDENPQFKFFDNPDDPRIAEASVLVEHADAWWEIIADAVLADGVPIWSRIEFRPAYFGPVPARGVTSNILRQFTPDHVLAELRRRLAGERPQQLRRWIQEGRRENTPGEIESRLRGAQEVAASIKSPAPKGRPRLPLEHWVSVATAYLEVANSSTNNVHEALEDRFGKSAPTINRWIATCAELGLLTDRGRGGSNSFKRGATPRLYELQQREIDR